MKAGTERMKAGPKRRSLRFSSPTSTQVCFYQNFEGSRKKEKYRMFPAATNGQWRTGAVLSLPSLPSLFLSPAPASTVAWVMETSVREGAIQTHLMYTRSLLMEKMAR